MNTIITFLNSQFISSMIGALLGAGVAVYVAKLQNDQQLKQLKDEHKLQREFFERQEANERERIFLQYTIERAERSYKILNQLKKAATFFGDETFPLTQSTNEDEFQKIFLKLCYTVITPKYYEFIDLKDELLLTLVIQDDVKLSELKNEVVTEVERFSNYYYKIIKASTPIEFFEMVDAFYEETELIEKCDNLKTYITKYVMDSAFRLVPPEKMAEKILKQSYGSSKLKFKVVKD
ncbi:hypothetical protein GPX02_01580 [Streptococcus thermophilus]|uniref:hypothetical protein n=1 Tax=Streptococcus thermophilus TaxID=1308 RepID=UPI0015C1F11F|nr:hypothetical protein [Streptococcus thermophilus]MCE2223019.1 hypothetical protein [Streptococcus thermophilus]MCE2225839.1 hypothetical protein [Streptococcus thermophilus]MCE2228918.1 hypothetical protein [Streptococcus thermophilus]MCE2233518.1 hypothetical protein [Streptococcus thermophilus]MCE2236707.1 hypothetical protein [Streptococcus thermophilus]